MKKFGLFFVCGLISVFLIAGVAAAKERVVVYTSLENEEIVEYLKVAKKELADLDIQAIRLIQTKHSIGKFIFVASLLLAMGYAGVVAWNGSAPWVAVLPALCLLGLLYYLIRLVMGGPRCDCWITSSVQKEKIKIVTLCKRFGISKQGLYKRLRKASEALSQNQNVIKLVREIRRDIARIKSIIRERELAEA